MILVTICIVKLLAAMRTGYGVGLIGGATDVIRTERRRSVLVPQETPLSVIHLDNVLALMGIGATVYADAIPTVRENSDGQAV